MEPKEKIVTIIYFYGGIGMGKTTLEKKFRNWALESQISYHSISLDLVSKEAQNSYKEKTQKNFPAEDLFFLALDDMNKLFEKKIKTYAEEGIKPGKNIFLFDQGGISSDYLKPVLEALSSVSVKTVALYPKNSGAIVLDGQTLPFSYKFILNMVSRVDERVKHETLIFSREKNLQLVFSFLLLFKNCKNWEKFCKEKYDWDILEAVEWHQEIENSDLEEDKDILEIWKIFDDCLRKIKLFENPFVAGRADVKKLTEMLESSIIKTKIKPLLKFGNVENWKNIFNKII